MKIDEQAEIIIKKLSGIQKDFEMFTEEMATLGKHLSNAAAKFNEANEKAKKIGGQIEDLTAR